MAPSRMRTLAAAIAMLGCQVSESPDTPPVERTLDSAAAIGPTPWYRRDRTLDLTGDGQADSVRLEAVGSRADSLRVILSLRVNGQERHREAWGSSYELALLDSAARVSPRLNAVVRAKLDTVLASVRVQRLDAPG